MGERGVNYSLEQVAERASKGAIDPRVRAWAIECLDRARKQQLPVKGGLARARVLLRAVQQKLWVPDPVATEFMAGAHLTACVDKNAPCFRGGDCFPVGTLVLSKERGLLAIEHVEPGESIWGLNSWTIVEAVVDKGRLPVSCVLLSNGSTLALTEGHFVTRVDADGLAKVRVADLSVDDRLASPDNLPLTDISAEKRAGFLSFRDSSEFPRVREVYRNLISVPCYDIQTEDHYVYLPEHDVTVNNCDDLTVLLAAAFASVGIHTLIVGHAYDKGKNISHVLCAAYANDQWWYADPSTDMPIGQCEPFTRERLLGVPNAKLICDKDACISTRKISPEEVEPKRGTFVGVNGLPELTENHVRWIKG